MKYCEYCRTYKNDDRMIFCETCRSQLIDVNMNNNASAPAGSFICPNCGNTFANNIGRCSFCGTPVVPLGANSGSQNSDDDGRKKKMIIIILAAVAAVLVAVFAALLIHDHITNKDADEDTTRITAPEEAGDSQAADTTEKTTKAADKSETEKITTAVEPATVPTTMPTTQPPTTAAPATTVPVITSPGTTAAPVSSAPVIRSATTLKGTVLGSSNVSSARSFGADQAIDGRPETCWCVNTNSTGGAGASIRFNLQALSTVTGIIIVNGNTYLPNELLYQSNGQIKECTLTFSDGSKKIVQLNYNPGTTTGVMIPFDAPVVTDSIILTVNSGYAGQKYTTNVCLGEFNVY